jgi:CheY-like chemotaxis protein
VAEVRGDGIVVDSLLIMVVEDDHLIQNLVEDALSDGGFESAIAGSGEEAVTLLRGNRHHYRALVPL